MRRVLTWCLAMVLGMGLGVSAAVAADEKPKPDLDKRFKQLDANSDGKLTEAEFLGKRTGDMAEKAKAQFKRLDKDSDGSLSLDEFKARGKKAK